jgi:hypothetical protein
MAFMPARLPGYFFKNQQLVVNMSGYRLPVS